MKRRFDVARGVAVYRSPRREKGQAVPFICIFYKKLGLIRVICPIYIGFYEKDWEVSKRPSPIFSLISKESWANCEFAVQFFLKNRKKLEKHREIRARNGKNPGNTG